MQHLNTQAQLLTELFLTKVKRMTKDSLGKFAGTAAYKKQLMEDAYNCLSSGFSYDKLNTLMDLADAQDALCYNLSEYIQTKNTSCEKVVVKKHIINPDNCLKIGEFYYHPSLQTTSRPPRFTMNPHTMELEKQPPEPFFLEMKDTFTVEELTQYFIQQTGTDDSYPQRHFTQFKNMVKTYGIDLVLYLIDASVAYARDEQEQMPAVPSFIQARIEDAKKMYDTRKEIAREGGLTHVYPKQRREAGIE